MRWYKGEQAYQQVAIGSTDDAPGLIADGVSCFTFEQAKGKAVAVVSERKLEAVASASGKQATVRDVVEIYATKRDARDRELRPSMKHGDARRQLTTHVLSHKIADVAHYKLSKQDLTGWRDSLSATLAPATVKRLVNDFKAALNDAAVLLPDMRAESPGIIKNGLALKTANSAVSRTNQILSDADMRGLIEAAQVVDGRDDWEGNLIRIVVVLTATSARFSQVSRMLVADVQAAHSRLACR